MKNQYTVQIYNDIMKDPITVVTIQSERKIYPHEIEHIIELSDLDINTVVVDQSNSQMLITVE